MERGIEMVLHAAAIGVVLYIVMTYLFKQEKSKAEDRSVLIGAVILIYMVLFGHSLPKEINKNILG